MRVGLGLKGTAANYTGQRMIPNASCRFASFGAAPFVHLRASESLSWTDAERLSQMDELKYTFWVDYRAIWCRIALSALRTQQSPRPPVTGRPSQKRVVRTKRLAQNTELRKYLQSKSPMPNQIALEPESESPREPRAGLFDACPLVRSLSESEGDIFMLMQLAPQRGQTQLLSKSPRHQSPAPPAAPPGNWCPAKATTAKGAGLLPGSPGEAEYRNGSASVQMVANKIFFPMASSSSESFAEALKTVRHSELYQHLVSALVKGSQAERLLFRVGPALVDAAEHAYTMRWMSEVEEVSKLLRSLPNPFHGIGNYYHGLCQKRLGSIDEARLLFEHVATHGPAHWRGRAILSLSTVAFESGDFQMALSLSLDACRAASSRALWNPPTAVAALRIVGVLKSVDGDHRGSLAHFDRIFPLARSVASSEPSVRYGFLNSLAVELLAVGRLEEAANASRIALASPYASAYPEWQETGRDISLKDRRPSHSIVAVGSPISGSPQEENTQTITRAEIITPPQIHPEGRSASILIFPDRIHRASAEASAMSTPTVEELAEIEEIENSELSNRADELDISEEVYEFLRAAEAPALDERSREIDLESPGVLEEMVSLWINGGIEPDELAAVLSAIRDCDDDLRRTNILDRMITYTFHESRESLALEELWRRKFEARLEPSN